MDDRYEFWCRGSRIGKGSRRGRETRVKSNGEMKMTRHPLIPHEKLLLIPPLPLPHRLPPLLQIRRRPLGISFPAIILLPSRDVAGPLVSPRRDSTQLSKMNDFVSRSFKNGLNERLKKGKRLFTLVSIKVWFNKF